MNPCTSPQNNGKLAVIADKEQQLDPRFSDSLAYCPLKREAMERRMEAMGLRNLDGCRGSKKWMNDKVMDALYARMEELKDKPHEEVFGVAGRYGGAPQGGLVAATGGAGAGAGAGASAVV